MGGSGPAWKGSKAGRPGRSSTVLLLLAKQESRLLGVSVLELLAGEALRAWLGDTNHHGSSRCRWPKDVAEAETPGSWVSPR